MDTSRKKVWSTLRGQPANSISKGEILITEDFMKNFSQPTLEAILSYLNADLVTLPIEEQTDKNLWRSWASRPYFVFGLFQGPFTLAAIKMGWSALMRSIKNNPEEVMSVMEILTKETLPLAYQALDQGCDGILVADDLAGNSGLLISPLFLERYYFPVLNKILCTLNYRQVPIIFHSDGNILQLVPYLKETGFWGIQSLQPSSGIKAQCFTPSPHWVYWGNFEFENSHRIKTKEEVVKDVNRLLRDWSGFSGYIFGSSGGLYQGLCPEGVKAAYQAVDHWSKAKKKLYSTSGA
ncbi:MAG: uroporphyrinogen decarboxylase family protein [Dehalobacterium sp.]